MKKDKQLSNPFSTGGGGFVFESRVQASFVILMLTGGYLPYILCSNIEKIKLQGRIDCYNTDDMIVFFRDYQNNERKLLCQIKHSIDITLGSSIFSDVIYAAWKDYNNINIFNKNRDAIVLITGPLSRVDVKCVRWILEQARYTHTVEEFLFQVKSSKFSPSKTVDKLTVFREHLKNANNEHELSDNDLYEFLKHFYVLYYDLDSEYGVTISLFYSYIFQFKQQNPKFIWSQIVNFVQNWNQHAGVIIKDIIPEEIQEYFNNKYVIENPYDLEVKKEINLLKSIKHSRYLAKIILIGGWQDNNQSDKDAVSKILNIDYNEWLNIATEILDSNDRQLVCENGFWKLDNRIELWKIYGKHIFDSDIDTFKDIILSVLNEAIKSFETIIEYQDTISIYAIDSTFSTTLKKKISEGLAILGCYPEMCIHILQSKISTICSLIIRELLLDATWKNWGGLNDLLPTLAEASPRAFLDAVNKAISINPCPFDELFSLESQESLGCNYLVGLLWALEALAWDPHYLFTVCDILADLSSRYPKGHLENHPFNSLVTILLPWWPQTLASTEEQRNVVQSLLREWPDVAWKLLLKLIPQSYQISSNNYRPRWRRLISDGWEERVTKDNYTFQTLFYAELAVIEAGKKSHRLSDLIDHMDNFPEEILEKSLRLLCSQIVQELPEEQKFIVWEHFINFINRNKCYTNEKYAKQSDMLVYMEQIAQQIAPQNNFYLLKHIFSVNNYRKYNSSNWEKQQNELKTSKIDAIKTLFQKSGIESVIQFYDTVKHPIEVGDCLGFIDDSSIDIMLLPEWLNKEDEKSIDFVHGFILSRYVQKGWKWCESLDITTWREEQKSRFLALLPFKKEIRCHISEFLPNKEDKYWNIVSVKFYVNDDFYEVVDKLILYKRPYAAIRYLYMIYKSKFLIDTKQCVEALLLAIHSEEIVFSNDQYCIIELIKYIQNDKSVCNDDICKIEFAYISLFNRYNETIPKNIVYKISYDPDFFCYILRLVYKPESDCNSEITEKEKNVAQNAFNLLEMWNIIPGMQQNSDIFNGAELDKWINRVKEICASTGHLKIALFIIGKVLIYAPEDPNGLWMHHAIANVLNARENGDMREGYKISKINACGVHTVDPTGAYEREIAKQFHIKADEIENSGYNRIAIMMRDLANYYDREAEFTVEFE